MSKAEQEMCLCKAYMQINFFTVNKTQKFCHQEEFHKTEISFQS